MVKNSNKTRSVVVAAAFGLFLATTAFATTANAVTVKNGVFLFDGVTLEDNVLPGNDPESNIN